jgi:hypothetical protein
MAELAVFVGGLRGGHRHGGRPYLYTSYDAASGGNIVNQVQQVYNGLGQLITEYQSSSGAVNTSTTPKVQYAYTEMAGGANHSRPITITYPNGRILNYNYNTGLDDSISRLSPTTKDHPTGTASDQPIPAVAVTQANMS